jgi:perosamine synthetase
MERIDELIAHKRAIFRWYRDRLSSLKGVTLNAEPPNTQNSYWMVTAVLDPQIGLDKFALMTELDKRNIDSRPFFSPLSSLPAFEARPRAKRFLSANDQGQRVSKYGVNLPSGYNMTEEKVAIVASAFTEAITMAA